jgi:transcriptional regulator with XRE-family HTH domain
MTKARVDPAILKARELFRASGMSLDELGRQMGAKGDVARKSAWQLLNKVNNPKISTLRALAKAFGVSVEALIAEQGKG